MQGSLLQESNSLKNKNLTVRNPTGHAVLAAAARWDELFNAYTNGDQRL